MRQFNGLNEQLRLIPSYQSLSNLASYAYYAGDYAKAVRMYYRVLQINKNNYFNWGNLANAYQYSGQQDSARYYYRKAAELAELELKINPTKVFLMSNLAGFYAELGKRQKALDLLKRVEDTNPSIPDVFFSLGDVYEQLGKRDLALMWMEKAIENGYTMARFRNNPALQNLIADERFKKLIKKE